MKVTQKSEKEVKILDECIPKIVLCLPWPQILMQETDSKTDNMRPFRLTSPLIIIALLLLSYSNGHSRSLSTPISFHNIEPSLNNAATCGLHAFILDNSCTVSSNFQVNVSGVTGTQLGTDVILQEVRFIISHTWDQDLDIWLYSPSGIGVELSTDNGGGADNYGDPSDVTCSKYTELSMNACIPITEGKAPFIGDYLPEGDFSTFNNDSDPEGTWIFQVCDDAGGDVGFLEYVELIFGEMSCAPPQNVSADTIGDGFVQIDWSTNNTCLNTIIEYGPSGFLPGVGASAGGGIILSNSCPTSQPFLISGLSQLSDYDVYIREACPSGGYSQNSCPLSFTTNCTTTSLTLSEDFDAQSTCATSCGTICPITGVWSNVSTDDFDWIVDNGGTGSANTGPSDDVSGGANYLYLETSGTACRNGNEAVLQSQCLLIDAAGGTCHLSFYYHMFGDHIDELALELSIDGGLSWNTLWNLQGSQGDEWWRQYIDLSSWHNQIGTFRFVGKGGSGIRGDIAIDEIEFFGTNLVSGPGTLYYLDADLDGFGSADDSTYFCSYSPPIGYVGNNLDCDDLNGMVSPLAQEIPCNSLDENCDGVLVTALLAPTVINSTICEATSILLSTMSTANGSFYWFDDTGVFLANGNTFQTGIINGPTTFFVMDSIAGGCSSPLAAIQIATFASPDISTPDQPAICLSDSFELSSIAVLDANNANGFITFHSGSPATVANQLAITKVSPPTNTAYYIRSLTSNGCVDETSIDLIINPLPTLGINPVTGYVEICSDDILSIMANELGTGTDPMTYSWDNGATNQQRTLYPSSSPGISPYSITVTDANGCTDMSGILLNTLSSITSVSIDSVVDVSFCGGNDGGIFLNPVNGVGPYDYQWSGPVSGVASNISGPFNMAGLSQGSYKVTITDNSALACDIVIPVIIVNGPGAIVDSVINVVPVECNGLFDGAIDITVNGGTPTFVWSNGATTEDLINVNAGDYSVTIMDGLCTTIIDSIVIPQPMQISLTVIGFSYADCFQSSDGWMDIVTDGGIPPYTYAWSHGSTTEDVSNLAAGSYTMTVTDANACTGVINNLQILEPTDFIVTVDSLNEVDCFGENNGSIALTVQGATAPYSFNWSNNETTEDLDNLYAGTYFVSLTDANNCAAMVDSFEVTQPSLLEVIASSLIPPTCNQIFDGEIYSTVFGGTAPYTYLWSNGAQTSSISNLEEGMYSLTVTDSKGCTAMLNPLDLFAPTLLFVDLVQLENETCEGLDDGWIDIDVTGGTEPYTYVWSNGASTQDINNLPANAYSVTVYDAFGCNAVSNQIGLEALAPLATTVDLHTDVSCAGQGDGSIYIDVPSGAGPYSYQWNHGPTTQDVIDLQPGVYIATIIASDGCTFYTDSMLIAEPPILDLQVLAAESPSCNGFFDGNIDVSISGGTMPYLYSWNTGDYVEDLSSIPSGNYNLVVLDDNGCIASSPNINLSEPDAIDIDVLNIDDIGCVDSIGAINLSVGGGIGPYTYWWNTSDTLENISDLAVGYYDVSVTDQNNCVALLSSIEVEQLADTIEVDNTEVNEISCSGMADASIHIEVLGGNYPFQYNWSNGITDSLNTSLSGSTYNVTVTDNYGCVGVSPWVSIINPQILSYEVLTIENNICTGDSQGAISVVANGGVGPYEFEWNSGADTSYIDQLPSGVYTLTVTDANGCVTVTTPPVEITSPGTSVQIQLAGQDDLICHGDTNGSIDIIVSGGVGGYTFDWSNGSGTQNLDSLYAGWYQCTVTDANGCSTISPGYILSEPSGPLELDSNALVVVQNTDCLGSDGSIDMTTIGGTPPYSFFWSNTALTEDIYNLSAGNYLCYIVDDVGCTIYSDTFEITAPENTLFATTYSTPDTNSMFLGTANAEIEGGAWPYYFSWDANANSQTDSVATGLEMGWYEVTINDANNCSIITSVFVDSVLVIISDTDDLLEIGQVKYFPNPASETLWVEVDLHQPAAIQLRVVSLLGLVLEVPFDEHISNQHRYTIDLNYYPSGVYFLELTIGETQRVLRKFVLTK